MLVFLSNVLYYINKLGFTSLTDFLILMFVFLVGVVLLMPSRYKTFQKRKYFGASQSKLFSIPEHEFPNLEEAKLQSLQDYQLKLDYYFTLIAEKDKITFNSNIVHRHKVYLLLAFLYIFTMFMFLYVIIYFTISLEYSFPIIIGGLYLIYRTNRYQPYSEVIYQLIFSELTLTFATKLKNGKSKKLRSIDIEKVDFVSYEQHQSNYRLIFGNSKKTIPFIENYTQYEVEFIYPIIGQFLYRFKNHTLSF